MLYFSGWNCYLASVISIAATILNDYTQAFATLWGETDFADQSKYGLFVSNRVYKNLSLLGLEIQNFDCSSNKNARQSIDKVDVGQFCFVGMDRFFVPWDPACGGFHEEHYFFAEKVAKNKLLCFDSIYDANGVELDVEKILDNIFSIGVLQKIKTKVARFSLAKQAEEALVVLPKLQEVLTQKIEQCKTDKKAADWLQKQVAALLLNRRLFAVFVHQTHPQFFDENFFSQWQKLKYGIFRQTLQPTNDLACKLVALSKELVKVELETARELAEEKR